MNDLPVFFRVNTIYVCTFFIQIIHYVTQVFLRRDNCQIHQGLK